MDHDGSYAAPNLEKKMEALNPCQDSFTKGIHRSDLAKAVNHWSSAGVILFIFHSN